MHEKHIVAIFVALVTVVIVGQAIAYVSNPYHTEVSAWAEDDHIRYSISTNTSTVYNATLLKSESGYDVDNVVIFEDENYRSEYDQEYICEKNELISSELAIRNTVSSLTYDANAVRGMMEDEIVSNTYRTVLLMTTGVLPNTIYDGTDSSIILEWLRGGGILYWIGAPIGKYHAYPESEPTSVEGYGMLFFGASDGIVSENSKFAKEPSADHEISECLNFNYNSISFGIEVSALSDYKSIGYSENGIDSMVFVKYHEGKGMIVNIGGFISSDNAYIIAQTISAGIDYSTEVIDTASGMVKRTTVEGSMHRAITQKLRLYVYLGTPTTFYAKGMDIPAA